MKKRWKILAVLISFLALAASIRIVYVSGFLTHKHPVRNTHVFTKKNNRFNCPGIKITAGSGHDGQFYADSHRIVIVSVSKPRIEQWHKRARIGGAILDQRLNDKDIRASADLALGESFTFKNIGTITLLDVKIDWLEFTLGNTDEGSTATYCFEPAPGFNVGDDYKSHYQKQHPGTPTPWPTTPATQTETTPLPTDW